MCIRVQWRALANIASRQTKDDDCNSSEDVLSNLICYEFLVYRNGGKWVITLTELLIDAYTCFNTSGLRVQLLENFPVFKMNALAFAFINQTNSGVIPLFMVCCNPHPIENLE